MKIDTDIEFEITNTCSCLPLDEESTSNDDYQECYGTCWEWALEDFEMITSHLFHNSETLWWKVSNLRLWDGESSGYFYAKSVPELIEGMTVRSAWIMRGTVFQNRIEYSLTHHDAMGSNTTLTMVSEEEREKLGLY